ncbi:MAG: transporter substrate-binding domain-containing protein [Gammaproteobacteria bacterium]|nr:transporter substrate-binding domain-containing protein [Gammaproteobacteria bacterium]
MNGGQGRQGQGAQWLISLLLWLALTSLGQASEPSPRVLTVAISPDSAPYHFVDADSQPAGVLVDVWKAWSRVSGQPVGFLPLPWSETLTAIRDGRADIHAGLSFNPERSEYLEFGKSLLQVDSNLFIHRDLLPIERLEQLLPYRLGVLAGSHHQVQLALLEPRFALQTYATREALYDAALSGEIMVFAALERFTDDHPERQALEVLFPYYGRLTYARNAILPAVAKGPRARALLQQIDDGMVQLPERVFADAKRRWLGTPLDSQRLRVGLFADFPPYSSVDDQGLPRGLLVDLWQELGRRSGHHIEFVEVAPELMLARLEQGELDSIVGIPAADAVYSASQPAVSLFAARAQFFVHAEGKIKRGADLEQADVGALATSAYLPQLRDQFPRMRIRLVSSPEQLVRGLQSGQFGAVIAESALLRPLIARHGEMPLVALAEPTFSAEIQAVVGRNNQVLAERLATAYEQIPPAALAEMEARWLPDPRDRYFDNQPVQLALAADETLWLTQHPRLRVGVLRDLPPLFRLADGIPEGVVARLVGHLQQRLKVEFEWVVYDHPQLLADAVRRNQLDLAIELQEPGASTQQSGVVPFWQLPRVILNRDGSSSDWAALAGKTVAIRLGDPLQGWLPTVHPAVDVRLFATSHAAALAVANGDVDGYIDARPVVMAALADLDAALGLSPLSGVPDVTMVVSVSSDQPQLQAIVSKQLFSLGGREREEIIGGVAGEDDAKAQPLSSRLLRLSLLLALLVIAALLWAWRRERQWRQQLLQELLQMTHSDPSTGVLNRRGLDLYLGQAMAIHARSGQMLAMVVVELRPLEATEEMSAEALQEAVMVAQAERLGALVRRADCIARIGTRQLALVVCNLSHRQQVNELALKLAQRGRQPLVVARHSLMPDVLVGAALFPLDATHADALLAAAEAHVDAARRGFGEQGVVVGAVGVTGALV